MLFYNILHGPCLGAATFRRASNIAKKSLTFQLRYRVVGGAKKIANSDHHVSFFMRPLSTVLYPQANYIDKKNLSLIIHHNNLKRKDPGKILSSCFQTSAFVMAQAEEGDLPKVNVLSVQQDTSNLADLDDHVNTCSAYLLNGGVVAVPTDTIYGIAGLSQKIEAVNRIYDIKQRNYQKPLAISVGSVDDIYRWGKVTVPCELLSELLPGPVTVVFERTPELNPSLNPDTQKVGIRIPGNVFMQKLAQKCGGPIALTSANISGGSSCLQIKEFEHLWCQLDLVVNGGILNDTEESRLGSTVVDLSTPGYFRIIRNGSAYQPTVKVLQDRYQLKDASTHSPSSER